MTTLSKGPPRLSSKEKSTLTNLIDAPWRGESWAPWFVRDDGHLYDPKGTPTTKTLGFHMSPARYRALFGGRGSGKSGAGAQEALSRIRQGLSGAVFNPDFENFVTSTWPEFKRWIPWNHVIPADRRMGVFGWEPSRPFTIHFDNGAAARCKGLKDPDGARGPNINWLWYDEGGRDKSGRGFLIAIGAVRIGPNPTAFVTTTPKGPRHWTNKLFVLQDVPEEVQDLLKDAGVDGPIFDYFITSIEDNRENLDSMFYLSMRVAYGGHAKLSAQELDGQIVEMSEGVVYESFSTENVTADGPDLDTPVELAFDDGYIDPRAILFIQRTATRVLVFDMQYHSRHLAETCVDEVVQKMGRTFGWRFVCDCGQATRIFNDPVHCKKCGALLEKGPDMVLDPWTLPEIAVGSPEAKELQKRFRLANIPVRTKGIPSVVEALNPVRNLILDGNGHRTLMVNGANCGPLIDELTDGYKYPDESARKSGDKPVDENNHACDALRDWAWLRART